MKKVTIICAVAAFSLIFAGSALAATYSLSPHTPNTSGTEWAHGSYQSTGEDVCKDCHAVHKADINSMFLMRNGGGTVSSIPGACMVCHGGDSTLTYANPYQYKGSKYFTGSYVPHTNTVTAAHYCEVTITWEDWDATTKSSTKLICGDCHNVHGNDVTTVFALTQSYYYNPIIGNRIGPSQSLLTGDGTVTAAYANLCGICHDRNDKMGQADGDPTSSFTSGSSYGSHPSKSTQTTMAYNPAGVGGQMTMGAVLAFTTVESCNDCHKRLKLNGNSWLPSTKRTNRTDAYVLAGAFHGGLAAQNGSSKDQKLLSTSTATPTVDEACLACHVSGNAGVGKTF